MGNFKEEITLTNAVDRVNARQGLIPESKIRQLTINAIVDTGASTIIINEEIQAQLGLAIEGTRRTHFANGDQTDCGITEPVNIRWKNRACNLSAVVIPGAQSVLLGALPLEDMDLIVNPVKQQLEGAHGDVVEALAL